MSDKVKIAVEGCCHGELDSIYRSVPPDVDLLIICGDFQALRNSTDLHTINVPHKYKRLGGFHQYYKGSKKAPVLTIFIGGNHECSSYMKELQFGGWVAPNIYYLGETGVVWFKGLRIGGWSGIYHRRDFLSNRLEVEKLPYDNSTLRSVYHVKAKNFLKSFCMGKDLDIVLSHDWPVGIENYGDLRNLLRRKPYFEEDIKKGCLGSPLNSTLLHTLKPRYWFSAHLHVHFEAIVTHSSTADQSSTTQVNGDAKKELKKHKNDDKIEISMDDSDENSDVESEPNHSQQSSNSTIFLALDKYGPKKSFLKVLDIPAVRNHPSTHHQGLFYDEKCIATDRVIERLVNDNPDLYRELDVKQFMRIEDLPMVEELVREIEVEAASIRKAAPELQVPRNFAPVAPTSEYTPHNVPLRYWENNQTLLYCDRFKISYIPIDSTSGVENKRSA